MLGRVQVQPDQVADLVDELRIGAQLEGVGQVWLEPERLPDPPDRGPAQPRPVGHRRPRPMGGIRRGLLQRGHDHGLNLLVGDPAGGARPWLVDQPLQPAGHKPRPPLAHRGQRHPQLRGDLLVGRPGGAGQHDPAPQRQPLGALGPPRPAGQCLALVVGQDQRRLGSPCPRHPPTLSHFNNESPAQDTSCPGPDSWRRTRCRAPAGRSWRTRRASPGGRRPR
jgi:hypothetical protein